jgi:hypothetical protein
LIDTVLIASRALDREAFCDWLSVAIDDEGGRCSKSAEQLILLTAQAREMSETRELTKSIVVPLLRPDPEAPLSE